MHDTKNAVSYHSSYTSSPADTVAAALHAGCDLNEGLYYQTNCLVC